MLTPVDVQNKVFKGGIGFDKKDVEAFMEELSSDYSDLYRSNVELKDKVATLNESLQHYRTIEESVQKSLTISEKAAEETINAAQDKARQINIEAELKAEAILADAKDELEKTQAEIFRLQNQHQQFVTQFKKILNAQLQLCEGEVVDIDLGEGFDMERYSDSGFSGFGSEGGLGGGGGYTGSYDDRDRAAGEPSASVGSLNFDPFTEAKNGGRFSSKTTHKSSSSKSGDGGKLSLNMKSEQPANVKIKRNIPSAASKPDMDVKQSEPIPKEKPAVKENTVTKEKAAKEKTSRIHEAQKAREEAARQKAEQEAKAALAREEAERKAKQAAEEAARREREAAEEAARQKAIEDAKNEEMAQAHYDRELEATINAVREAAKKQNEPQENPYVSQPVHFSMKSSSTEEKTPVQEVPQPETSFADTEEQLSGEVEEKIDESTMLDSEDNYSDGFDFISDSDTPDTNKADQLTFEAEDDAFVGEVEEKIDESTMLDSEDNYSDGFDFISDSDTSDKGKEEPFAFETDNDTFVGEVEDKIDESTMLDSEDNYSDGFDFVSDSEDADSSAQIHFETASDDETAYVGEVEEKVNESNMLDSEDNYNDGFDFLVDDDSEDDIPTIQSESAPSFSINSGSLQSEDTTSGSGLGGGLNLNINFGSSAKDDEEDVFVGDVEDKNVKPSNLIGNDDDEDDGFNFL